MDLYENITLKASIFQPVLIFQFVSDRAAEVFNIINLSTLGAIIATFGLITNVINIIVFLRQGFGDTVNVSLFALALCDFCSLLTLQWVNLLRNPLFNVHVPFILTEVFHLTGGWPHAFSARMTSWITAYITLERCLCVLIPLKVKRLVTPKLATIILVAIFVCMILTIMPDYATAYLGWKPVPDRNVSLIGLLFTADRPKVAILSFTLSAYTQILSFVAVVALTTILVIKMREKSRWRASASSVNQTSVKGSLKRDSRTVIMIILIAIIYCVCLSPMMISYLITHFIPEFNIVGKYQNSFLVAWAFSFLLDSINSSVNIIVYYKMSTKYRVTFHEIFGRCGLREIS